VSEQESRDRFRARARELAARLGWREPDTAEPDTAEQQALALCFRCVTGTCGHRDQLTPVHSGTVPLHGVPAITARQGTPLCLDCAMAVRAQ
jgi:hypothetical protein